MTPPANGQADSAPKHSSPNDLTKFVTPDPASIYAVASGGYGSVYKCIYKEGEQSKHVIHGQSDTDDEALWREIGIWKRMRHKCIVPLLGTTAHDLRVSFVSSWMPNGTLNSYLEVKRSSAVKYSLVGCFQLHYPLCIIISS
ncbi:hypothetical protein M405DRAFT_390771 [Rhizopogon salebrosus TDB-379]|nr:hypothetical protein M405DRAFT_390771 [Rhizopogon salebrosus TDB-379]